MEEKLNDQEQVRFDKLQKYRDLGVDPFGKKYEWKDQIRDIRAKYGELTAEQLEADKVEVNVAGRLMAIRRMGKASLVDTFCYFVRGELWVKNMHIAEYFYGSYNNHAARRDRKLLLTRKELRKLERDSQTPGFTIVPTRLYINEKGLAKVVVALAKGKKEFDKRETLKEKDARREMERYFKK